MNLTEVTMRAALGTRPFRYFEALSSTNDAARTWMLQGAPEGAVVVAEEQTAGRGRFGRVWTAPRGTALLMSVILKPYIAPRQVGRVTMLGAVALAETLALLPSLPLEMIGLKWPNDVQLGGRKVAGILAEAIWEGERAHGVVLGIGINVRIDFGGTPLAESATSIERVTGVEVDRADLLDKLLKRIDYWAARINERSLLVAWRGRLTTLGQRISVRVLSEGDGSENVITGQALDVDDDGALCLRDDNGEERHIVAGDVTLH